MSEKRNLDYSDSMEKVSFLFLLCLVNISGREIVLLKYIFINFIAIELSSKYLVGLYNL